MRDRDERERGKREREMSEGEEDGRIAWQQQR